ncbi:uncharacterized protein LOC127710517 [Mytilus californianus]|uniref:uncharacterized protein LOC127710517 n=1 Tax=Mytilus californianus TaxID=6549 RepID=UPI002245EBF8|nr:uncharacterized protein LOC127710517 [Mytilus californianus]
MKLVANIAILIMLVCTHEVSGNPGSMQKVTVNVSTNPVPIRNTLYVPLVAELDANAINAEIKVYIEREIANGVKIAMEELAASSVNKKVDEATAKLGGIIQEKCVEANSEIQENIGTTYVQWGRTNCTADDTKTVYSGFVGGSSYTKSGSAVDYLCLINDPQWGIYDSKVNANPFIGGALFHSHDINVPNSLFDKDMYDHHRVPCSVCQKMKKASTIMIPARKDCYGNLVKEYDGYLYAGYPDHEAASEYICLDKTPEALDKSHSDWTDKKLLYPVRVNCNGAIPCPPYVDGREVTCVVCSS